MKLGTIIVVLSATLIATPALANWFQNYQAGENHKKLLGGTASPTQDDLRAIGDSKLGEGKSYHFDPRTGHWHEVRPDPPKAAPAAASGSGSPAPDGATAATPAPPTKP